MNERQCFNHCKFWDPTEEDLYRGDGSPMDTVRTFGWCSKHNKSTYNNDTCDDYEQKSHHPKQ